MHLCSSIYFMHCNLKKREGKVYQCQSVQRFFREYTYAKHIPDFDSLQLSQKLSFKIHKLAKNLFRLNIFTIYFPLKLIVFTVHIFSIWTFSLYQTKLLLLSWKELILIISITNASLNIDWLARFSCCKLLIGFFEFNRKPV